MKDDRILVRGLLMSGVFALLVAGYGALQLFTSSGPRMPNALSFVASCGCFGLLIGTIYAFDRESEIKVASRPFVRTCVSGLAGLALSVLWAWPGEAMVLSTLVAAMLGAAGMTWAKYVDF